MAGDVRPPKLLCPLCEFEIDHRHHHGYPPIVPCRACFVGLHGYCDPATYFCACDCGLKGELDGAATDGGPVE